MCSLLSVSPIVLLMITTLLHAVVSRSMSGPQIVPHIFKMKGCETCIGPRLGRVMCRVFACARSSCTERHTPRRRAGGAGWSHTGSSSSTPARRCYLPVHASDICSGGALASLLLLCHEPQGARRSCAEPDRCRLAQLLNCMQSCF